MTVTPCRRARIASPLSLAPSLELAARLAAILMLGLGIVAMSAGDDTTGAREATGPSAESADRAGEYHLGAYSGVPYTHPSDVRIRKSPGTDLTIKDVPWEGRPFRHPIYYGVRALGWRSDTVAVMLDFTHSKTIPAKEALLSFDGTRNGKAMPARAKVGDTFRHFEFSHGHNMLAANAVFRLPPLLPRARPYVGAGPGVNIPHTEVQFVDDPIRTYMYQLTGLMAQGLVGLEIALPRGTAFLEYKFTLSRYDAPLMDVTTTLLPADLLAQFRRWIAGKAPEGGWLHTVLASHQLVAGLTGRIAAARPTAPSR